MFQSFYVDFTRQPKGECAYLQVYVFLFADMVNCKCCTLLQMYLHKYIYIYIYIYTYLFTDVKVYTCIVCIACTVLYCMVL